MNKLRRTFKEYVFNEEKVRNNVINGFEEEYKVKKGYLGAGLVIIAIVAVIGYIGFTKWNNRALSYVTISINPEVELALNTQDEVVEVIPINEDADILISDLNLVGMTVEEASEKIIDAAMETGYLDEYSEENTVVVTTVNDDEEVRQLLEEKVMNKLNAHFESRKIYPVLVAKGLDDELKAEAESYDISNGKMLLIERAVTLNTDLSKEELVDMSVRDIQKEIQAYVQERHDALKETLEAAKVEWQERKVELKQEYVNKVNQLRDSISEEMKEEFKNLTSEQKKAAIDSYLNNKKEEIKNSISEIKEEIKSEIKDNMSNYNYPILKNNAETIKQNIKDRIQNRNNN